MVVGGRAAALLPLNLPHLQNLIKRDPESYRSEFLLQQTHFYSTLSLQQASGWSAEAVGLGHESSTTEGLEGLVNFMSHVIPSFATKYPDEAKQFVETLMELLERDATNLPASLRRAAVQGLVLLRSRRGTGLVPTERFLRLLFRLFALRDKPLRMMLYNSIVGDVRRANHPHRNNALNRSLQNFMYSVFQSSNNAATNSSNAGSLAANAGSTEDIVATKSLQVIIELYRRGIWNDAKTVNIIAEAACKSASKASLMALNFFLGKYPGAAEVGAEDAESDSENDNPSSRAIAASEEYRSLLHACQVGGVSKAKQNRLKRVLAADRKRSRGGSKGGGSESGDGNGHFSPISLVNDPQGFAERLFRQLKSTHAAFEIKLIMMNVVSRFISWHKLILLDFYPFLLRYLQPHQKAVTQVLAYTAQATHALIPPDALYPVLKAIADNFVNEGAADAVIAAGLNGIREICARSPHAMTETLLHDLTDYKRGGEHKNKGIMMASRSLISLFRELNPELLKKQDRGREITMAMSAGTQKKSLIYGEEEVADLREEDDVDESVEEDLEDLEEVDSEDVDSDDEQLEELQLDSDELEFVDDEDDDDDDVSESEDESVPQLTQAQAQTQTQTKKKIKFDLPTERILLPEDYEKSKKRTSEDGEDGGSASASDSDDDDDDESVDESGFIDPSKIEGYRPKAKADYEARMASVLAGREGREKFGTRKRGNPRASTTNKEKSKGKNFLMMAHKTSVRGKKKRSLKQRQAVLKKHKRRMKLKK